MASRCREIIKLADDTYNQYVCYGHAVANAVMESLKAQREFARIDLLLSNEEKKDMVAYVTTYILELLCNEILQTDLKI